MSSSGQLPKLDAFDRYNGPAGLLRRYVVGRVRAIYLRLLVAAIGVFLLTFLAGPKVGILAALITFPLELAEYFVLRRQLARDRFDCPATGRVVFATSALQTLGLAGPIILAGTMSDPLRILAWAYMLGALLNTFLAARYHMPSHRARSFILTGCAIIILGHGAWTGQMDRAELVTEGAALTAMGYMLAQLFGHLKRREERATQAERQLIIGSEEAQRLALVAENATDSVMLLDPKGRVTWTNPQFTRMTGYTFQEVQGRRPGDFLNHAETDLATVEELKAVGREARSVNVLLLNRRKDGSRIWVEAHQSPVLDPRGQLKAIVSVERDATERMERAEELRRALAAAELADREKAAFLSRMSHELRTPANGIVGGTELLRAGRLDPDQESAVSILEDASARMMRLIEDILNYSEIDTGNVKVRSAPTDISALLDSVVEKHRPEAQARGLRISAQVDGAPIWVQTDLVLLMRLLDKLVCNAVKFTETGEIEVTARHTDDRLRLAVRDTGVGISKSDQTRIFDRFEQADGATTRARDGAGLGLSLALDIARLLGGNIEVESATGEGSTFSVDLELDRIEPVKAASPLPKDLHLLVAEDNRTNRLLIEKMFKGSTQRITFANDGLEAVDKYVSARPDMVLMDLSMPNKDGLAATRDIRQTEAERQLPRCPIVAVTANASDADRQACFEAGMDAFLSKPLRKARLFETMGEVLR